MARGAFGNMSGNARFGVVVLTVRASSNTKRGGESDGRVNGG